MQEVWLFDGVCRSYTHKFKGSDHLQSLSKRKSQFLLHLGYFNRSAASARPHLSAPKTKSCGEPRRCRKLGGRSTRRRDGGGTGRGLETSSVETMDDWSGRGRGVVAVWFVGKRGQTGPVGWAGREARGRLEVVLVRCNCGAAWLA